MADADENLSILSTAQRASRSKLTSQEAMMTKETFDIFFVLLAFKISSLWTKAEAKDLNFVRTQ